ncbi:MAG: CCA tRNA nucleotidyltransferase [Armatimonadota bacterium]|nr:CCA tRNA nucleotidyltransferase [Armatimonadota bacterium]MDR7473664.1 CCA tRNA nucleotidyltransferase [Armatimonadota bacterium]MDR7539423.1 CCA tRNA nucleotidyltransferase [Armatimonadota bacterium]
MRAAGWGAYLVGGAVRDLLMGRSPRDIDIVTEARPEQVRALFARTLAVGAAFGVVEVVTEGGTYHVATFRREGPYLDGRRPSFVEYASLEEDVSRRDFTINALLYDPLDGAVIDLVGGRQDLEARRIRAVGDPEARFAEDHLRMLRAVRLAAELDFAIEEETFRAIQRRSGEIARVSGERIRDELLRLLTSGGRAVGLDRLRESGLLAVILPEVAALEGVEQPPEFHPEGDVLTHTRLALAHLRDPSPVLALGVLLHDVGKPLTFRRAERIRFDGHDEVGARMAEAVCRRLRLKGEEVTRVVDLVREHLRVRTLPSMRPAKAKRFLARPDIADHLELHRADCLASHGDLSLWRWAQQALARLSEEERHPPRLVSGDDLIARGYPPGPRFRQILEAVRDAQLEGMVRTREEALALVERRFPRGERPDPAGDGKEIEPAGGRGEL